MATTDDLLHIMVSTIDNDIYNETTPMPASDITFTERIIIGTFVVLICIFGFFGNSLTVFAVLLSKKLRTTTNVFVAHLAIADLLSCLFQPWDAIGLWNVDDGWPIAEWICTVSAGISLVCLCFTIIDLALIAINRYLKIMYPLRTYQRVYSARNITIMLTIAWLYCFCVVIIPPCLGIGRLGYSYDLKTCTSDETNQHSSLYTAMSAAAIYPIPLIIVIVCYTKILLYVRKHQKIINERRQSSGISMRRDAAKPPDSHQIQVTKNLMYVVVAFVICLGPLTISISIDALKPARHWTGLLALSNSAINPVIYGLKHPGFREVFGYILKGQWKFIPEPASFVQQFRSTARANESMQCQIGVQTKRFPVKPKFEECKISNNDECKVSFQTG